MRLRWAREKRNTVKILRRKCRKAAIWKKRRKWENKRKMDLRISICEERRTWFMVVSNGGFGTGGVKPEQLVIYLISWLMCKPIYLHKFLSFMWRLQEEFEQLYTDLSSHFLCALFRFRRLTLPPSSCKKGNGIYCVVISYRQAGRLLWLITVKIFLIKEFSVME
jgi:hypothetical protein